MNCAEWLAYTDLLRHKGESNKQLCSPMNLFMLHIIRTIFQSFPTDSWWKHNQQSKIQVLQLHQTLFFHQIANTPKSDQVSNAWRAQWCHSHALNFTHASINLKHIQACTLISHLHLDPLQGHESCNVQKPLRRKGFPSVFIVVKGLFVAASVSLWHFSFLLSLMPLNFNSNGCASAPRCKVWI